MLFSSNLLSSSPRHRKLDALGVQADIPFRMGLFWFCCLAHEGIDLRLGNTAMS